MDKGTGPAHVQAVLTVDDRVLRNYWVTQTYSDLAAGLSRLLDPNTANWCTFGTWASDTVGRNIRGEDLPKWLHDRVVLHDGIMGAIRSVNEGPQVRVLSKFIREVTSDHVFDVVRELLGACALNLSNGNTEVFAEIAPAAATFISCYGAQPVDFTSARARVLEQCDGAPPFEGVNRLRAGFSLWCDAMEEVAAAAKSQRILAGSLQLGAHEQHHLQGAIAGSMDMGINQIADLYKQRLVSEGGLADRLERAIASALDPVVKATGDLWGDLMTKALGTIETPDGTLLLDRDVPSIPGQPFTPPELVPMVDDDLATLLARFDRSDGNGVGSAAADWVKLDDRMNFIANLFVSRHHRTELFQAPFSETVVSDMEAGRIPSQTFAISRPALAPPRGPPPTIGTRRFTDELLEGLRTASDWQADKAVSTFFDETGEGHAELFARLARLSAADVPDEQLPGVGPFVAEVEPWPEWADAELVKEGQRFFRKWGPQLGMALWMASLPADYACAQGAEPLARTARLTGKPKRRYVETGQMIINAMTSEALEPGALGYSTIRHVRLMHAAVRHLLLHTDDLRSPAGDPIEPWDDALGVPLNQEDLLGCLFSFSVVGIDSLRRSGVRVDDAGAEAYIHAWNLVGHQIGIRSDLLPLDWADSKSVWEHIKSRAYGQSDAGSELTAAAIDCMRDLIRIGPLEGLPASGIRHYLGDQTAELLGVPAADWTRWFFTFVQVTDTLFDRTWGRLPGVPHLSAALGLRMLRGFERAERDGDRPNFQITDELRAAWNLGSRPADRARP
ncbi:MAG TPA: oxygenase MpaB family protein [Acidimicrobiales bacterium]|nr:oxygenase MpaB family protein [Acidimicrobiales bacterium]